MRVTLIRHAESIYNKKGLLQGQIDCSLSRKGLSDTKEKSKHFRTDFDICFCSPLKRTKQTAEIFDSRILEFLEMIKNNYNDKKVLIITHRGVICAIFRILRLKVKTIENLEMVTIEF